jgi:glycosyltransferase involved in cell wall biosynthesis
MTSKSSCDFGVVVIGRNEGERLKRCVLSLPENVLVVYVDSGSTDGSVEWVKEHGIEAIELDTHIGFTAARARNAGFGRLRQLAPELRYVQFIDGDCELAQDWPRQAISHLDCHEKVCAVFGRRRERYPSISVYNRLCDIEWDVPIGQVKAFGGDVMIRAGAIEAVEGYRNDLIAGEEPELCVRLRARGWRIWRLDAEMTLHDAAMTQFGQWWRRHVRSGYAFAEGAHLHGAAPERHWVRESRRALIWGLILPAACCLASALDAPWGFATWLIYPLQMLRLFFRGTRPLQARAILAMFYVMMRFPEAQGYLKFTLHRLLDRRAALIEYKR